MATKSFRTATAIALACLMPMLSPAATLTVDIKGVRAQSGLVLVSVLGSAEAWQGQAKPAGQNGAKPSGDALRFEFPDLAPGSYAVKVMHDENGNGKLDSNFVGMPTEGYGFSNNPRVMRPATYEEARFRLTEQGTTVSIELH